MIGLRRRTSAARRASCSRSTGRSRCAARRSPTRPPPRASSSARSPAGDRIAVFAVGKRAVQLTDFSPSKSDADAALRTIEVDAVRGTALYDAVVLAVAGACGRRPGRPRARPPHRRAGSLERCVPRPGDRRRARGQGRPSIRSRSRARASGPDPLQRLAQETGGRYSAPAAPPTLHAIYAALATELRRTWQRFLRHHRPPGREHRAASQPPARRARGCRTGEARPQSRRRSSKLPSPLLETRADLVVALDRRPVRSARNARSSCRAPVRLRAAAPIAPHLGEARAQATRRARAGALRDRLDRSAGDRGCLRAPAASGTSSTGCSSAPTFRSARSSSSTSTVGAALLAGLVLVAASAAASW